MRLYELVLVLKTSLSDAQRKKVIEQIKDWMGDAKVTKEDEWGQKPLAYKIKRELAGFYHKMELESENAIPTDLETRILRNDDVLRHLLIRTK